MNLMQILKVEGRWDIMDDLYNVKQISPIVINIIMDLSAKYEYSFTREDWDDLHKADYREYLKSVFKQN